MELDDFKQAWRTLAKSAAINERLLREVMLGKTRRALAPFALARAIESVLAAILTALAVRVLAAHASEARYWLVAGPVVVLAVLATATCGYLVVCGTRIDYGGPVARMQREVAWLAVVEFHATKWAILAGTLLWLPVVLVGIEALTGSDVIRRVDAVWLAANLAFGAGVLVVGHVLANRFQGRLADALAGRSLRRAREYLNDLAEFQVE